MATKIWAEGNQIFFDAGYGTEFYPCDICRADHARLPYSNIEKKQFVCPRCSTCRRCARTMTFEQVKTGTGSCEACLCVTCKGTYGTVKVMDAELGIQCNNCFKKTHPQKVCLYCRQNYSEVHVRGDKIGTPSACQYCVNSRNFPQGAQPPAIGCFFCNGAVDMQTGYYDLMINGKVRMFGVCDEHVRVKSCGKNDCRPNKQCAPCKAKAEKERPPHERQEPCNCAVCVILKDPKKFYFENPNPTFYPAENRMARRFNTSPRFLSVEIEIAGYASEIRKRPISDLARKWGMSGIVTDQSLPRGGFEINTAPAAGDIFLTQVDEIEKLLLEAGAYVTDRCGTHVHVDVRDHNYEDIKKFLLLYAKVEPALIRTQPYARVYAERSHCAPCGEQYIKGITSQMPPKAARTKLIQNVYGSRYAQKAPKKKRGNNREIMARYNALNVHSYWYRGTLECRLHNGTINAEKIKTWGMLWAGLVDAAYALSENEIRSLKGDALQVLTGVIPPVTINYVLKRIGLYGMPYGPIPEVLL